MHELEVVTAEIPAKDGCPILTRLRGFVLSEGVAGTLEFQFSNSVGRPIDLRPTHGISESSAVSDSASGSADQVVLRIREYIGTIHPQIWQVVGTVSDAAAGKVRVEVPAAVAAQAGVYALTWGFKRDSVFKLAVNGVLLVERSLFGFDNPASLNGHTEGPPTIAEIRLRIEDSSPRENLLMQEIEFSQVEIASALVDPVRYFNEQPPPIRRRYDTTNFPFLNEWIDAAIGRLYRASAANYRRNSLSGQAGGQTIDLDNEKSYLAAAELQDQKWRNFVYEKKLQLNANECIGELGSDYGYGSGY